MTRPAVMQGHVAIELAYEARAQLAATGSDAPLLEAELLMSEVLGMARAGLLAHWRDYYLSETEYARWQALLQRRLAGEPLAYILGHREFFGLDLETDSRALIPRPETEMLVEATIQWCKRHAVRRIADIGTGSGAIAIALATHLPDEIRIIATDISTNALDLACANAGNLGVTGRIDFYHGNLAAALPKQVDCIVANLPYIDDRGMAELAPQVSDYEPRQALYGGPDGLDLYRRLFRQLASGSRLRQGGGIFCEIAAGQGTQALALAERYLPDATWRIANDLAGHTRMLFSEAVPGRAEGREQSP